jgi:phosphoribosylformimino-5-aminoimidazole carboxamide ribotide isomerase
VRIIGVIDLAGGKAVHARAGRRAEYTQVRQVAGADIPPGDALALATAYRGRLGLDELYVADLDAIVSGQPQHAIVRRLADVGPMWLDAGISSVEAALDAIAAGATRIIVGLETLTAFDTLADICTAVGSKRVAFSLDLRDGLPIHRMDARAADMHPQGIAARAVDAGASTMIVIDLARVGTGSGTDPALLAGVRKAIPGVTLIAGGGVRVPDHLSRLAECGCDGVLLASSLHDGRIGVDDVAEARRLQPSVSR